MLRARDTLRNARSLVRSRATSASVAHGAYLLLADVLTPLIAWSPMNA